MSKESKNRATQQEKAPLWGDPYWKGQLEQLLSEFGAETLPDLGSQNDESSKKGLIATRVRRKYIVRRIRQLKKDYEEPQLSGQVTEFLGQARLQTRGAYWRELDQVFHTRGVFML